ncbi:MAG: ABC transporter substrate-binding protein [Rhodobiaceae bacterium]|jgi:microcin C transport system substrate-binding protein|nr:ABC transporter substrate-binding protein [Rhodobiaceae bacterium]
MVYFICKLKTFCLALALLGAPSLAHADEWRHGLSLFGEPDLKKGFAHFPYVNPKAPKGGDVKIAAIGSFDNLNAYTIKGNPAEGLALMHDTLMTGSMNEASANYGLIAEAVKHPSDFSSVSFKLRRQARFSDGSPITAEDVAFSLTALKKANPSFRAYYSNVVGYDIASPHEITFRFSQTGNRELPMILGQLPILKKAYWNANQRSLANTTLEIPPVSGAYKIAELDPGRAITYARRGDYWGKDLNVNIGKHNIGRVKYVYFGDDTVAFEALKAGEIDYRREFSSRIWATGYDTPAVRNGQKTKEIIALENPAGMQGFVFNLRRERFDDIHVREALNWAYDFEWTKKNLFYGQYARTGSFFQGSELAASGTPSRAEVKLLAPWRAQLPEKTFGPLFQNPIADGSGNIRKHLRKARALLEKAGWKIEDGKLKKNGKPFTIEFLLVQPAFERIVAPYIKNLAKLGIDAKIRTIDPTQYQNRVTNYDYDAIVTGFGQSLSPGNEQRNYWSASAASQPGGRNYIGIENPAVDALVETLIFAKSREALITATRALDRVLISNHYVMPQWHSPHERLAYWQGLKRPDPMPKHGLGFPTLWWKEAR